MKKITFGKISSNFAENSVHIKATGTIGVFGPPKAIETIEEDDDRQKVKEVMGISSFGKKAKTFDIQEMIAQVKATAKELAPNKPLDDSDKTEDEDGSTDDEDGSTDDDDFIGPPVPETLNNIADRNKESDDDDVEEHVESSEFFMPIANETEMVHGTKAVTAISVDPSGARLASGKCRFYVELLSDFL